jgi:methionine-gamma-lyase
MSASASSTSSELSDAALAAAGIGPGQVRMSIGITGDLEDRWSQLLDALRAVGAVR